VSNAQGVNCIGCQHCRRHRV